MPPAAHLSPCEHQSIGHKLCVVTAPGKHDMPTSSETPFFPVATKADSFGYSPSHMICTHTLLCRKSKAPIGSSGLSQPSMPGHGVHWDVSQTRTSATTFSIGSGSAVQRSGASMNSVGTHLGSSTGQGLVSATYSPLSHQGSLLRKDVDNQKNLRQADLNSVKRTPLSLKVGSLCCKLLLVLLLLQQLSISILVHNAQSQRKCFNLHRLKCQLGNSYALSHDAAALQLPQHHASEKARPCCQQSNCLHHHVWHQC